MRFRKIIIVAFYLYIIQLLLVGCNHEVDIYKLAISNHEDEIISYLSDSSNAESNKDILAALCINFQTIIKSGYEAKSEISKDILEIKHEKYKDRFSHKLFESKGKEYAQPNQKLVAYLKVLQWRGEELHFDNIDILTKEIISNKKTTHFDVLLLYMQIDILANIQYSRNQVKRSLASLHYFLYQIENHPNSDDFTALKDLCLQQILIAISRENYDSKYNDVKNNYYNDYSDDFQTSFWGLMTRIYIDESDMSKEKNKIELDKALEKASSPGEYNSAHFNLAFYYSTQNDTTQHFHYYKAIESMGLTSCAINRFYPAISGLANNPTPEQKKYYNKVLKSCNTCPSQTCDRIEFIVFNYLEPSLLQLSQRAQLDTLISIKHLGEKLYPGKSTLHLQDYYNMLLSRIFDVAKSIENEKEINSIVINEVLDLRFKEKFRKSFTSSKDNSELNYEHINKLLLKNNSFKTSLPYDNPLYNTLFHLYLNEEQKANTPYIKESIALTKLKSKLKKENAVLTNIVQANDRYNCYILSTEDFNIVELEKYGTDSLLQDWIKEIKNKKASIESQQILSDRISNLFKIDSTKNLILIPDGQFSIAPVSDLFSNGQIEIYQNVVDFMESDSSISINKSEFALYSYSDHKTIKDHSSKEIPELRYGFKECQLISKILGNETRLNSGLSFLAEDLFNVDHVKMAHIASHASSSSINHLDNFIVSRNQLGEIEKTYGYNIPSKRNIPEVVILSGCETGTGIYNVGAGVQTLSRSLLDNDSKTVIKTLWKVNDQATVVLMENLYQYWITGNSLYSSLKLAKEEMQSHPDYSIPYYWSGFVLVGNPEVYFSLD